MSHSAISCNVSLLFKLDFGRKHFGLVGGDYVFKHCQIRGVWSCTSSRSSCGIPPSRNPCVPRLVRRPKPPWCSSKYFAGNIRIQRQLTASRPKGNLEQTKSFLLWPPREEGKYPEEVTFKKPIATASVFLRSGWQTLWLFGRWQEISEACLWKSVFPSGMCGNRETRELFFKLLLLWQGGPGRTRQAAISQFFGQQIK